MNEDQKPCAPPSIQAIFWLFNLDEDTFKKVVIVLAQLVVDQSMCPSCAINTLYEDRDTKLAKVLESFEIVDGEPQVVH